MEQPLGQQFEIRIVGLGENGCDKQSLPGQRLFHRCKKLDCIDCRAQDLVQLLRQQGYRFAIASFTHNFGSQKEVVDDLLKGERKSGAF